MTTNHNKRKRANDLPWMVSRLRRLDSKLGQSIVGIALVYNDMSEESLDRCRNRAHRLACDIQVHPKFINPL